MDNNNVIDMKDRGSDGFNWRNYTKVGIFLLLRIALIIFVVTNVFIVKEGEYRVIRQFGEVVRIVKSPGLSFKVPFIQSVTSLPKYQMTYDVSEAEINTKDKKRMIIDNYAIWRIEDPKKMISNARSLDAAESRM